MSKANTGLAAREEKREKAASAFLSPPESAPDAVEPATALAAPVRPEPPAAATKSPNEKVVAAPYRKMTLYLREEQRRALRMEAASTERDISEIAREAIDLYLAKNK